MIPPGWRYINALKMPALNTCRVDVTSMPRVDGRHVKGLGQFGRDRRGEGPRDDGSEDEREE